MPKTCARNTPAPVPGNWGAVGNSPATGAARFDDGEASAALNLTLLSFQHSEHLFPLGGPKALPDLAANLGSLAPQHAPGAWVFNEVDRSNSLKISIEGIRINQNTKGKLKDLFESFSAHVKFHIDQGSACTPRAGAGAAAGPFVPAWEALGESIAIVGAALTAVAAPDPGTYPHFEETLFGTINALAGVDNGPAHVTAGGPITAGPVAGFIPVRQAASDVQPGVGPARRDDRRGDPQRCSGAGNTNRARVAATARGENMLFMGLVHAKSDFDSTLSIPNRLNSLAANAIAKTNGRTVGGVGGASNPPSNGTFGAITKGCLEEFGLEGISHFSAECVYATPANPFPAAHVGALPAVTPQASASAARCCYWDLNDGYFGNWGEPFPYTQDDTAQMQWYDDRITLLAGFGGTRPCTSATPSPWSGPATPRGSRPYIVCTPSTSR